MAEVYIEGDAHRIECTITVAGESYEIFFRSDLPVLAPNGDIGVALGILASMQAKEDLIVQSPVSGALLRNVQLYQEIVSTWWYPELAPVGVKASVADRTDGDRIASFFSGGADSFYTAWKYRGSIDDWILIRGLDISMKEKGDHLWSLTRDSAANAAEEAGARLVVIETDLRRFSDRVAKYDRFFGAALASVGLAMRHDLGKLLIPSSNTYRDLAPNGAHPLLDPLWGGDGLEVVHDGADKPRVEKLRAISEWPVAMKHLRVCTKNVPNRYNCGVCEKCLRTLVNLYAVGALGRCETLPGSLDLKAVRRQFIEDVNVRNLVQENLVALDDTRENRALRRALKQTISRSILSRARRRLYLRLRSISYRIPSRVRRMLLDGLRRALG